MIAASSFAIPATLRALHQSMRHIRFGAIKFLTDKIATQHDDGIEWVAIAPLTSRTAYSRFMLQDLHHHVMTPYVLVVQWDGYVLHADAWNDQFLQYDYIGAPWPQFDDGLTVGNGGFSLRSARLLAASPSLQNHAEEPEDVLIARRCRALLESDYGIRFAEEDVAHSFAFERFPPHGAEFGFHGIFNMATMLDGKEFRSIYSDIEARLLGFREQRDLVEIAICQRSLTLLLTVLRPHFRVGGSARVGLNLLIAGTRAYMRSIRRHKKAGQRK